MLKCLKKAKAVVNMRTPEQVAEIVSRLEEAYPLADCTLDWGKDYELLFSVRLAAQCTDERVNMITPALFERYPTLESFAEADVAELHLRAAAVPAHVAIRVSRVHNNGASAFRCNAIQALEGVVAEAQTVARRGRHGRQAAVAFFPVAVGVALRVGLRAERPALAGEAGRNLLKMKVSSLAGFAPPAR